MKTLRIAKVVSLVLYGTVLAMPPAAGASALVDGSHSVTMRPPAGVGSVTIPTPISVGGSKRLWTSCRPVGVTVSHDALLIRCMAGTVDAGAPLVFGLGAQAPEAPLVLDLVAVARTIGARAAVIPVGGFTMDAHNRRDPDSWFHAFLETQPMDLGGWLFIEYETNPIWADPVAGCDRPTCQPVTSVDAPDGRTYDR